MVFHWSLSNSKSHQIFRTHLSIPAVLNNGVVWMVSTSPPTPKSSSPFNSPLVTVPNVSITIGTFMFFSFFSIPLEGRFTYLSFNFLSVLFCGQLARKSPQFSMSHLLFFSFFLFSFFSCWLLERRLFWPRICDPFVC